MDFLKTFNRVHLARSLFAVLLIPAYVFELTRTVAIIPTSRLTQHFLRRDFFVLLLLSPCSTEQGTRVAKANKQ